MTVEEIKTELENIIAGLRSTKFSAIDAGISGRLELLHASATEHGLNEGSHLINNLITVVRAIQEGKSKPESGNLRLVALEFYLDKLSGSNETEELLDVIV